MIMIKTILTSSILILAFAQTCKIYNCAPIAIENPWKCVDSWDSEEIWVNECPED